VIERTVKLISSWRKSQNRFSPGEMVLVKRLESSNDMML